ncbi:MAG TPA: zinc ribbon domain-containing protein [Haliangiales bacterium]|nr:zinc ribbon domain-containing protein [Haliangiales bacterium]
MRTRGETILTLIATILVAAFVVLVLWLYRWRPTLGAVFLVFGWMSLLATAYFLARAVSVDFGRRDVGEAALSDDHRAELEREKKLLLKAIKEAEFDRELHKLDAGEADSIIQGYRARAIEILRALEPADGKAAKDYGSLIEAELAKRLAAEKHICAACGKANDDDAAFCKGCGKKLSA